MRTVLFMPDLTSPLTFTFKKQLDPKQQIHSKKDELITKQ